MAAITLEDIYKKQCAIEAQNAALIAENAELKKAVVSEPSKIVEAVKGGGLNLFFFGKAKTRQAIETVKEVAETYQTTAAMEMLRTAEMKAAQEDAQKAFDQRMAAHGFVKKQ